MDAWSRNIASALDLKDALLLDQGQQPCQIREPTVLEDIFSRSGPFDKIPVPLEYPRLDIEEIVELFRRQIEAIESQVSMVAFLNMSLTNDPLACYTKIIKEGAQAVLDIRVRGLGILLEEPVSATFGTANIEPAALGSVSSSTKATTGSKRRFRADTDESPGRDVKRTKTMRRLEHTRSKTV